MDEVGFCQEYLDHHEDLRIHWEIHLVGIVLEDTTQNFEVHLVVILCHSVELS
jgi:hypothetical protein